MIIRNGDEKNERIGYILYYDCNNNVYAREHAAQSRTNKQHMIPPTLLLIINNTENEKKKEEERNIRSNNLRGTKLDSEKACHGYH